MKQVTVLNESLNHSLDQFFKRETVVPEITHWVWVGATFEEITLWPFCIHWMCVVRIMYRHTTSTMSFSDATLLLFTTPLSLPHEKLICPSDAHLGITLSSRSPGTFHLLFYAVQAHWKYVPEVRFLQNGVMLLVACFATLLMWNVPWLVLKARSFLSDEFH